MSNFNEMSDDEKRAKLADIINAANAAKPANPAPPRTKSKKRSKTNSNTSLKTMAESDTKQEVNYEEHDPNSPNIERSAFSDFEDVIFNVLYDYGFLVRPGGNWQNLTIKISTPSHWGGRNFKVFQPANYSDGNTVKLMARALRDPRIIELYRNRSDKYAEVFACMTSYASDPKTVVSKIFGGRYWEKPQVAAPIENGGTWELYEPPTRTGTKVSDMLLSWLPEAERRILMLTIGRIFCKEGPWRVAPLITGRPGLGKSTFIQRLEKTISRLGVTTTHVQSPLGRFSLTRDHLNSDVLITDDTTSQDIRSLTVSSIFKSVVSGCNTVVEEKFKTPISIKPNVVYILLGNQILPSDLIGADTGVLDRIVLLNCLDDSDDIEDITNTTADFYNTDIDTVMEWMVEESYNHYQENRHNIAKYIADLRSRLILGSPAQPLVELAAIGAILYANETGSNDYNECLTSWDFSGIIDAASTSGLEIPDKLNQVLIEVNWSKSRVRIINEMFRGRTIQPTSLTKYISCKSGTSLPSTLSPYRKAVMHPEHQKSRLVLEVLKECIRTGEVAPTPKM